MFRTLCDVPWFNIHKLLKKYNFSFSDIICPWKNEDSFKDESLEPNDFSQYEKGYTNTNRLRGKLKKTEISNEDEETTTKNGKCSLCKQEFENYQLLKLHIKCIHSETNCNQCKKEFKTSIKLENHIKKIHERTFDCKICDLKLFSFFNLQRHIKQMHDNTSICDDCHLSFQNKSQLRAHMAAVHKGPKKCQCDRY